LSVRAKRDSRGHAGGFEFTASRPDKLPFPSAILGLDGGAITAGKPPISELLLLLLAE